MGRPPKYLKDEERHKAQLASKQQSYLRCISIFFLAHLYITCTPEVHSDKTLNRNQNKEK